MAAPAEVIESKNSISDNVLRFIESGTAESLGSEEILTWSIKNFSPKLALSCSFGAPGGLVRLGLA